MVYPAAGFAPMLAARGMPVAEFNLEETPVTGALRFHFQVPCSLFLCLPNQIGHLESVDCVLHLVSPLGYRGGLRSACSPL